MDLISKLDARIKERQAELAELQTARRVLQSLASESQAQSQTATTSASPFADPKQVVQIQSAPLTAVRKAA